MSSRLVLGVCACALFVVTSSATALVPDNGAGTAHMPIRDTYLQESSMFIIDGLPAASTIRLDGVLVTPADTLEQAGGSLGGTQSAAGGSGFQWSMQGTGAMAAYNRNLFFAIPSGAAGVASFPTPFVSGFEVHAAPRTAFAPVQSFNTDMFRMFGQIAGGGDPDFDLLRLVAGTDFGLPSPGHTTLTQAGPNWAVDSFFDITYRIDFVGHPGGPFSGMSGSTTGTVRISIPEPVSGGMVLLAGASVLLARRSSGRVRRGVFDGRA